MADIDSLDVLHAATGRGMRSSEFWLVVVTVLVLFVHPTAWPVALAVAAIVSAYVVSRGVVKAATSKALLSPVEAPLSLNPDAGVRPIR